MANETRSSGGEDVTETAVCGMVNALEPGWRVETIERNTHGTDFTAVLEVRTAEGPETAVLKATTADLVDPVVAKSEPRLLQLVGRETTIPVPTVFGYCDEHEEYPAPFYLMTHVDGENYEGRSDALAPAARERIISEAGRNLAELHMLGPLPGYGKIGVWDDQLTVLDTDDHPRFDDFRDKLLAGTEDTLDSLTRGGYFPELAEDPSRFADLVPALREYVRATIPSLPAPEPPTYHHWDYRYGNLLVDPETGATQAVLDWANLSAADPVYNLTKVEGNLLTPETDSDRRTETLRETFRTAYAETRENWSFDEATRERMHVYRLTARVDDMACLPLWYQDPEEREERAAEHREFVNRYV